MQKTQILDKIGETRIIPVIRNKSQNEAKGVIEAVLEGGINVLEITMTTPNAIDLMEECVKEYGDAVIVGAGTVVDLETAKKCFDAGVKFIVSPMFDEATVKFCNQNQTIIMPGALTPTEIFNASNKGADVVKVFPVSSMGGVAYLKAVKSVYPNIEIVPTGGVNLENFADFLSVGAFAVGIGSDLTGGDLTDITRRTRDLSGKLKLISQTAKT